MKPVKKIFYDLETTGVDHRRNGIHQLAGCIEIDGEIVESFNFKVAPNLKLMSVAREVGILIDESKLHDANYDILITRAVYNIVTGSDFEL